MPRAKATTSASEARYNDRLFQSLIRIYDPVTVVLLPVRKRILAMLGLPRHARVLDVASGTGTQALMLAHEDYLVTGLDLSKAMLKRAREKSAHECHVEFIHGDATRMPFKRGSFDASVVSFGLHDMPEELRVRVIKEMMRVTKKGAPIIIADYATPADGIVRRTERRISNLFESVYYDSFMETGLSRYLVAAGLRAARREVLLFGIAQVVRCKNP